MSQIIHNQMCSHCAFRKDCETWHEPENRVTSQICAAGPIPFLCHASLDWTSPLARVLPVNRLVVPGQPPRVCAGWKQAVRDRQWPEDPALRRYQRWLAGEALLVWRACLLGTGTLRGLHNALRALDRFYKGPRAWQIGKMIERKGR